MIVSWQFIQFISQRTWIYNNFSNGARCLTLIICDIKLIHDLMMSPIIFNKICHHKVAILNHVTWYIMMWMSIHLAIMMMSSNGNIFCITGPLCGEFTGHRWIHLTKASDAELWCFFYLCLNKQLSKPSGYHHAHYDVTVMTGSVIISCIVSLSASLLKCHARLPSTRLNKADTV